MKREISSVVEASTLAIAPVASGTSASVLRAAAPCQRAKRCPEDGVLVDSVMGVLRPCGKRRLYAPPRARPTALRVLERIGAHPIIAATSTGRPARRSSMVKRLSSDPARQIGRATSELQSLMRTSYAV